jgi:FixJ family two-component response regulator
MDFLQKPVDDVVPPRSGCNAITKAKSLRAVEDDISVSRTIATLTPRELRCSKGSPRVDSTNSRW